MVSCQHGRAVNDVLNIFCRGRATLVDGISILLNAENVNALLR